MGTEILDFVPEYVFRWVGGYRAWAARPPPPPYGPKIVQTMMPTIHEGTQVEVFFHMYLGGKQMLISPPPGAQMNHKGDGGVGTGGYRVQRSAGEVENELLVGGWVQRSGLQTPPPPVPETL